MRSASWAIAFVISEHLKPFVCSHVPQSGVLRAIVSYATRQMSSSPS